MSSLLVLVGPNAFDRASVEPALGHLFRDPELETEVHQEDGLVMAVGRREWQFSDDFDGPVGILRSGDLVVAADASIYYRAELKSGIRGRDVCLDGETSSHLLAGAYRAWGERFPESVDGDFAAVIWDRKRRRLVAARDRMGFRPLYYARLHDGFALSSSAKALTLLPDCSAGLNVQHLGLQAAGLLWSCGQDTVYRQVEVLQPAHTLVWIGSEARTEGYWDLSTSPDPDAASLEDAAVELRHLLERAVVERLGSGTNTVWMSGGRDSTAVFGAGQSALEDEGSDPTRLRPVSISYPEGDPGREDGIIQDVADRWKADVAWLDSSEIPLAEGLDERAAEFDQPPAHLYELWNRALARGTRRVGGRLALDGAGGDNLFQVSGIDLADHLRRGRIDRYLLEGWKRRRLGLSYLALTGVLPLLPSWLARGVDAFPGVDVPRHYLERPVPPWIRQDFVKSDGLRDREVGVFRSVSASTYSQEETLLRLVAPIWSWGGSFMRGVLLREGVEVRSPLFDRRIVRFALSRPVEERSYRTGDKVLLRRAMDGLLPTSVTSVRNGRSGITTGYSRQRMQEEYPALIESFFAEPVRLADLGIVDPRAFRNATEDWDENGDFTRVAIFHTLKTEFWLRGQESTHTIEADSASSGRSVSSIASVA